MTVNSQETDTFGGLLRLFRKRARLTQQQLAEALGMHRHTIRRWEQGDVLPAGKATVLELSRRLRLTEQEARHLLEASLTALSPHWSVPFARNPFFTGREDTLRTLHAGLGTDQLSTSNRSYALCGLGGVGKTQIALEYAYRHALEYSAVLWIDASGHESIVASMQRIGEALALPQQKEVDRRSVVVAVQHWLSTHTQWLVICDNLDEPENLRQILPPARQGALLITTRCPVLGPLAPGLDLEPLGIEEGLCLLLQRARVSGIHTGREDVPQDERAAAEELVKAMGGLPLALDQAGAYIEETGCSFAGYLRQYEQRHRQFLERRGRWDGDHPHSVVTTLTLACEQVARRHPAALELLYCCAYMAPDSIPEQLFIQGACHLGPLLGPVAADPFQFDQTIAALRALSLLQRSPQRQAFSVHRLVQIVVRDGMGTQEQALWQRRVVAALNATFPEVTHEGWQHCEQLLPHVLAATSDVTASHEQAVLLRKTADYLRERAQYEQAELFYQQALRVGAQVLGAKHPQITFSLTGLAQLYQAQGKYHQAEPLYQQSLHIWEHVVESDHSLISYPLYGMALLYQMQGKLEQAEPLYQQSLHIGEQVVGPEHPLVAYPLAKLGDISAQQGNAAQAEAYYQRALQIREKRLGQQHPDTARSLVDLARLYQKQGREEQAEELLQKACAIFTTYLGESHPETVRARNSQRRLLMRKR